jgi:ADP-dependent NAD(P)H-hydrate dehydratase / NAD(P)H-hydrate epimerase
VRALSGPVLTAPQMRAAEIDCGVPLLELMERAGAALAEAAWRFGAGAPVLVLCGPGNNGGDGYVAARVLAAQGAEVAVAMSGPPTTDLARAAADNWIGPVRALTDVAPAPVLIDALFGTGMKRSLAPEIATPLHRLADAAHFVIAADLPSGLSTDDGRDLGAAQADLTVAMGAAKPVHLLQPGAAKCGRVLIAEIGISASSDWNVLERPRLLAPRPDDHKYTRGMVAIVPGEMAGAATLGASAAARLAGYTILCGKGDAPASVVRRGLDKTLSDPKLNAILIGPGLGDTADNRAKFDAVLASSVPLVLDAGALALVKAIDIKERPHPVILTPHEGEFERLFGVLPGSKADRAQAAAARCGHTVILKGADTVIASADGRVTFAPAASPWLASAGTGDILAGIAVAMLGQGMPAHDAACSAVWLHAAAARRAGPALIADDLPAHLAAALAECLD